MNIQALFEPKSIAVVGASTEVGSVGNDIVRNLVEQQYTGAIFPVNPKTNELYGIRCYPNLAAIEGVVECVVIAVPAKIVPQVLREAVEKGVRAAVVISAGFGEAGNADLEREIAEIARAGDMALLGPNCLGVVNPHLSMNASFAKTLPKKGSVAFLSQSGALGTAILDMAGNFGIGISKFASLGNKALLDESALLEYFARDKKTRVVAIYAEDLRNPERIKTVARAMMTAKRPKPIIVLKSGTTKAGAIASSSHTGSLAGNDASYNALFEEVGILRAETAEELFLLSRACSLSPLPAGRSVAILTNAGGPGVLSADATIRSGLTLAPLAEETVQELRSFLPAAAGVKNPVDILGDAKSDRYVRALEALLADASVDMVLVVLTPQSMTDVEEIALGIVRVRETTDKPIIAAFLGGKLVAGGIKTLLKKKIPVAAFPEDGIRMFASLARFAESRVSALSKESSPKAVSPEGIDRERARELFRVVAASGRHALSPVETLDLFQSYGFSVPEYAAVKTAEEADRVARERGVPLAMKILSSDITHKSDAGGILLDVAPEGAAEAFQTLLERVRRASPKAAIEGVLLMEMAPKGGIELIVGSFRDPNLGQTILLGSGGIYVEILNDTAFGLVPISRTRAERMLANLRIFPLLDGARGGARYDTASVVDSIVRLSCLLGDFPDICELDINPLLVYPGTSSEKRVLVVDGRVAVSEK